jgi:hypothetical protein
MSNHPVGLGAALVAAQRTTAAIVAAVIVLSAASCGGGGGGDSAQPPAPGIRVGAEAPSALCSGADLSKLTSSVYVSTQGADGAGCGQTTKTACQTLQQGIANCAASGCGVIARHGLYPTSATLALRDGVNVYGGCRFDGEADRRYRTVIRANPAPGLPALAASSINSATTVHGLVVIGKDETAGVWGTSHTASIAMTVSDSTGLTLTGSVLSAGKGGDGADGVSTDNIFTFGKLQRYTCGQTGGVVSPNIWGSLSRTIWTPTVGGVGPDNGPYNGPDGGGGQQGGASIALVLANSSLPSLTDQNAIVAGIGGVGGNGAPGNVVWSADRLTPLVAGSGGAGGNGGPSIVLALTQGSPAPASGDGVYVNNKSALGGEGGAGSGIIVCTSAWGDFGFGGAVADIVSMQSLPNNLLTPGQTLADTVRLTSPDGLTLFVFVSFYDYLCVYRSGPNPSCKQLGFSHREEVVMLPDGNLCEVGSSVCTNTAAHPGAYLAVRNDGSAAILDGSEVLWRVP